MSEAKRASQVSEAESDARLQEQIERQVAAEQAAAAKERQVC